MQARVNRLKSLTGFTLVELVVVLAILVALAGLVISKVDFLRRQSTMATAAASTGDLANNIELYVTTNSAVPNGFDSLLDETGAVYTKLIGTNDDVGNLYQALTPVPVPNAGSDKRLNSLVRMGMSVVNDNLSTSTNATESGTSGRLIVSGTGLVPSEPITAAGGSNLALVNGSASQGASIWKAVYPSNIWTNSPPAGTTMVVDANGTTVSLVAFGVGSGCSLVGTTMTTPPQMAGPDTTLFYYRYVAIFAIFSDGRRAQLKTVLDSFGRTTDGDISNYNSASPESLPPGSRTPE